MEPISELTFSIIFVKLEDWRSSLFKKHIQALVFDKVDIYQKFVHSMELV